MEAETMRTRVRVMSDRVLQREHSVWVLRMFRIAADVRASVNAEEGTYWDILCDEVERRNTT